MVIRRLPHRLQQPPAEKKAATATVTGSCYYRPGRIYRYTQLANPQCDRKEIGRKQVQRPHFYLTMEINMDNAMTARPQLNEVSLRKDQFSFNDLVVKASALALRQHPAVNASWMGDKIRRYQHIHIGIAVAIEDGLIVPVVRFCRSEIAGTDRRRKQRAEWQSEKYQNYSRMNFPGNTFYHIQSRYDGY
ncbi:MAG: 2-oxo acid dehydrogenase subunit E2 [Bacteroidota bacterium]